MIRSFLSEMNNIEEKHKDNPTFFKESLDIPLLEKHQTLNELRKSKTLDNFSALRKRCSASSTVCIPFIQFILSFVLNHN